MISQRMYTVEAINLIVVTLRHTDGSHVYQPISLLCTLPLSNLTRSANKREMLTLLMDYRSESAFGSTMDRVRQCVRAYVTANPSNLAPDFYVNAAPAENPLKIKLLVRYTFTCPGATQLHTLPPPPLRHCQRYNSRVAQWDLSGT